MASPAQPRVPSDSDEVLISGTVWLDEELHGLRQPSDPVLARARILAMRDVRLGYARVVFTDESGHYEVTMPSGAANIIEVDCEPLDGGLRCAQEHTIASIALDAATHSG